MNGRIFAPTVLAVFVVIFSGCTALFDTSFEAPTTCTADLECGVGEACCSGVCSAAISTDNPCGEDVSADTTPDVSADVPADTTPDVSADVPTDVTDPPDVLDDPSVDAVDAPDATSACDGGTVNACGGCAELEASPSSACGVCETGVWTCTQDGALNCEGDAGPGGYNACGGCEPIEETIGGPCGDCDSGELVCDGDNAVQCAESGTSPFNECGGCSTLDSAVGLPCSGCGGTGELACAPDGESLICASAFVNACGGCSPLDNEPSTVCGPCGRDRYECAADGESTVCDGASYNACGGCSDLEASVGGSCGPCGRDTIVCASTETVRCDGDTRNSCGGCMELPPSGARCEGCAWEPCVWECDTANEMNCVVDDTTPLGFVRIEAGRYTRGSPLTELGRANDEVQHSVSISRDFWLQSFEVTQGEWRAMFGTEPSEFAACGAGCAVESVNWWEAAAFANARSSAEGLSQCYNLVGCSGGTPGEGMRCTSVTINAPRGDPYRCRGYRLPTEGEWEYAARAGTTGATYAGAAAANADCTATDPVLTEIAWYCANTNRVRITGLKDPNAWGLYDMIGNVWEWVHDEYGTYPTIAVTDPTGAAGDSDRVLRGGSWASTPRFNRAAYRRHNGPASSFDFGGFRLARTVPIDD